jgi:hypothetical protein
VASVAAQRPFELPRFRRAERPVVEYVAWTLSCPGRYRHSGFPQSSGVRRYLHTPTQTARSTARAPIGPKSAFLPRHRVPVSGARTMMGARCHKSPSTPSQAGQYNCHSLNNEARGTGRRRLAIGCCDNGRYAPPLSFQFPTHVSTSPSHPARAQIPPRLMLHRVVTYMVSKVSHAGPERISYWSGRARRVFGQTGGAPLLAPAWITADGKAMSTRDS